MGFEGHFLGSGDGTEGSAEEFQGFGFAATREKSVVPDADKSLGKDMQQEA